MNLKIYITCLLALLGLAGCGEHRDQINNNIHELLGKAPPPATASSITGVATMSGQETPRPVSPPSVQPHTGLVPVPSPSVGDVVALTPPGVGTIPATKQYKAAPGDPFDVIRENAKTIKNLDSYFSK